MVSSVIPPHEPRSSFRNSGWRLVAIVAIAGLILVAGVLGYVATRSQTGGAHWRLLYSGTLDSGQSVRTTDCAPYDIALKFIASSCNATQVSVLFTVNSTNNDVFGPNSLLVSLNVTAGPTCIVAFGGPSLSLCRYILELVSPATPTPSGAQPPTVNATIYLVNESQTWVFPASVYTTQLTARYINFGPVAQFTADLKIQLATD